MGLSFPLRNGIKRHFIYFCLGSRTLCWGCVRPVCAQQELHKRLSGLLWPPLALAKTGTQSWAAGRKPSSRGAGSRSWAQFPGLTAASSWGGPSWPSQLTRWRPGGSCVFCRLLPTEIEAGSGSPRWGFQGPSTQRLPQTSPENLPEPREIHLQPCVRFSPFGATGLCIF